MSWIRKENWQIFVAGALFTVLVSYAIPWAVEFFNETMPDTFVLAVDSTDTYTLGELEETKGEYPLPIIIKKIQPLPRDEENLWIPMSFGKLNLLPSQRLYKILIQNRGDGCDRKVKIKLDFGGKRAVDSIDLANYDRIRIIEGGASGSSFVTLLVDELLPDERQQVNVIVRNATIPTLSAWSEVSGEIANVGIFKLVAGARK